MSNSSISPIDRTLSGAATLGQSGPGTDGNEGVLCIPQSSSNTEASSTDCLVLYLGHSGESYSSVEVWCILQGHWAMLLDEKESWQISSNDMPQLENYLGDPRRPEWHNLNSYIYNKQILSEANHVSVGNRMTRHMCPETKLDLVACTKCKFFRWSGGLSKQIKKGEFLLGRQLAFVLSIILIGALWCTPNHTSLHMLFQSDKNPAIEQMCLLCNKRDFFAKHIQ